MTRTTKWRRRECPLRTALAALVALPLLAAAMPWRTSGAQEPGPRTHAGGGSGGGRSIGVWSAVARNEPLSTRLGHTHDRDLYMVGVRAAWPLAGRGDGGRRRAVSLDYTLDLLPAVFATRTPSYASVPVSCPPDDCGPSFRELRASWRTVYGAGVAPLGLALRIGGDSPVGLVLRGSAGIVYFTHRIPDPAEERLNFSADVGAGVELRLAARLALSAGYRLDHLSNGGRGPVNPGMNSRMLEVGTSLHAW